MKAGNELPKHAHLLFKTEEGHTLWYIRFAHTCITDHPHRSFVDTRRFGRWEGVDADEWGDGRGPDPLFVRLVCLSVVSVPVVVFRLLRTFCLLDVFF